MTNCLLVFLVNNREFGSLMRLNQKNLVVIFVHGCFEKSMCFKIVVLSEFVTTQEQHEENGNVQKKMKIQNQKQ